MKKLFSYFFGKKSELSDLDVKDVLLAKTVLDIHRKKTHSDFVLIPLFSLQPVHAIDRENALAATAKRVAVLENVRGKFLESKKITRNLLGEHLPSISWIKVVREDENSYIAYEGNGRLAALQEVFSPDDGLLIEVEEYYFTNATKILRRMNRVRRLNNLL